MCIYIHIQDAPNQEFDETVINNPLFKVDKNKEALCHIERNSVINILSYLNVVSS